MADWTIIKILEWTESYFKKQSHPDSTPPSSDNSCAQIIVDSPRLTAEILLAHVLGLKRLDLYLQHDRPLEPSELANYKAAIKQRMAGEPVAYITGVKGFYESEFKVQPGVLIPRPDTETLVEQALEILNLAGPDNTPRNVLELGVGSGAVIVSLAKAAPHHCYMANDLSHTSLETARHNNKMLADGAVNLFGGSWFSALRPGCDFDLIISNPPYIPTPDIQTLQPEVCRFEPMLALDGGDDGLEAYRLILDQAVDYLAPGGQVLLEIGFDQKPGLEGLLAQSNHYKDVAFITDLAGHHRVVKFKKID